MTPGPMQTPRNKTPKMLHQDSCLFLMYTTPRNNEIPTIGPSETPQRRNRLIHAQNKIKATHQYLCYPTTVQNASLLEYIDSHHPRQLGSGCPSPSVDLGSQMPLVARIQKQSLENMDSMLPSLSHQ